MSGSLEQRFARLGYTLEYLPGGGRAFRRDLGESGYEIVTTGDEAVRDVPTKASDPALAVFYNADGSQDDAHLYTAGELLNLRSLQKKLRGRSVDGAIETINRYRASLWERPVTRESLRSQGMSDDDIVDFAEELRRTYRINPQRMPAMFGPNTCYRNPSSTQHAKSARLELERAQDGLATARRLRAEGSGALALRAALMAHSSAALAWGEATHAGLHELSYQAMDLEREAEREVKKCGGEVSPRSQTGPRATYAGFVGNPSRQPNAYLGDAVARAKYKKAREEWERGGRRGPPPRRPSGEERRLRVANPSEQEHFDSAVRYLYVAEDQYKRAEAYARRAGAAKNSIRDAQVAFDYAVKAVRHAYFASHEYDMIGEPERRDAASRIADRAFRVILHLARQYNVRVSQPYPNPPSHVHRGIGGDLLKQATYYLEVAEKAEEDQDMGKAWDAVRHAECDLRMAYTELSYAGGASGAELAKLESAYHAVRRQKDQLAGRRRQNPSDLTSAECEVGRRFLDFALANGTFDLDYTFWANEDKRAYKAVKRLIKSGHLKVVWQDGEQITAEPTSKGWGEFVLSCT